jgi:hypothetical protein
VELGTRLAATGAGVGTVRVAGKVVTEPAELDTVQVKTAPLLPVEADGSVYVLDVAPVIGVPFSYY